MPATHHREVHSSRTPIRMYSIANALLAVSILDPIADRERFGTRYCTGGYIFQVADAQLGPLMSGPRCPDGFSQFDGQGIPDAFNLAPLNGPAGSSQALILGIGLCDREKDTVLEFCRWDITHSATAMRFRTRQAF